MIYSLSMRQLPPVPRREGGRCTREPETRPGLLGPPPTAGPAEAWLDPAGPQLKAQPLAWLTGGAQAGPAPCSLRGQRVANWGAGASPQDLPTPQVAISHLPLRREAAPTARKADPKCRDLGSSSRVGSSFLPLSGSSRNTRPSCVPLQVPVAVPAPEPAQLPAPLLASRLRSSGLLTASPATWGSTPVWLAPGPGTPGGGGWVLSPPNLNPRLCIRPGTGAARQPARLAQPPPTVTPPNLPSHPLLTRKVQALAFGCHTQMMSVARGGRGGRGGPAGPRRPRSPCPSGTWFPFRKGESVLEAREAAQGDPRPFLGKEAGKAAALQGPGALSPPSSRDGAVPTSSRRPRSSRDSPLGSGSLRSPGNSGGCLRPWRPPLGCHQGLPQLLLLWASFPTCFGEMTFCSIALPLSQFPHQSSPLTSSQDLFPPRNTSWPQVPAKCSPGSSGVLWGRSLAQRAFPKRSKSPGRAGTSLQQPRWCPLRCGEGSCSPRRGR